MKLTKTNIDKAVYEKAAGARDVRWDSEVSGFGLRVYPSGKKAFVLSYWFSGRKHLMTVGLYGVFTLEDARNQARRELVKILDGIDPLNERKRNVEINTFAALAKRFIDQHSKVHKKSWKDDNRRLEVYVLPGWKNFEVNSITRSDVFSLHQKIGLNSIYDANRTISLLGTMFKFAAIWGYLDPSVINPARGILKFKERTRDRWLTPEEMPRVAQAIESEGNPYVRAAIWLYLLTGLRRSELLATKWVDIDWVRKEIRLETSKNGSRHYVPLSEAALATIRTIPKQESNPYLIVGSKPGAALVNISKPWDRIRRAAKVEDVRLHDLRRTTGSWLAQKGNSLHLIARVLNHKSSDTTRIYARFGQDHIREALEAHGQAIVSSADLAPDFSIAKIKLA